MTRLPAAFTRKAASLVGTVEVLALAVIAYVPFLAVLPRIGEQRHQAVPLPRSRPPARTRAVPVGPARRGSARCLTRTSATCSRWARGSGCSTGSACPTGSRSGSGSERSRSPPCSARGGCSRCWARGGAGALAGALVYVLTPYQLAFTARISVLLLPWAGLPWLIGTDDPRRPARRVARPRDLRAGHADHRWCERIVTAARQHRPCALARDGDVPRPSRGPRRSGRYRTHQRVDRWSLDLVGGRVALAGHLRAAGSATHRERADRVEVVGTDRPPPWARQLVLLRSGPVRLFGRTRPRTT